MAPTYRAILTGVGLAVAAGIGAYLGTAQPRSRSTRNDDHPVARLARARLSKLTPQQIEDSCRVAWLHGRITGYDRAQSN